MKLSLDDKLREPLQSQLTRKIRAMILREKLQPGTSIPSIRSLAISEAISIITVQRAYNNLERDGLIHSRRGKGFYVSVIRNKTRKMMAKNRLTEDAAPLIHTANSEGLDGSEITTGIDGIIQKIDIK